MDKVIKLIRKTSLRYRLSALEVWKAQTDDEIDHIEQEQIRLCTQSIKLAVAIKDIKKELEELNEPHS